MEKIAASTTAVCGASDVASWRVESENLTDNSLDTMLCSCAFACEDAELIVSGVHIVRDEGVAQQAIVVRI